jgi:Holliday junction resolvasome RuvABC endonuclease subunit
MKRVPCVVGIDPSLTGTGIVRLDRGEVTDVRTIRTSPSMGPAYLRYREIMRQVKEFLDPFDNIFIEDYAYGITKGSRLVDLAEVGSLIKMVCLSVTSTWPVPVATTTVKKMLTGKGTSKHEDLKLQVYKKYDMEFMTTDEIIAFGVALVGACLLGMAPVSAGGWRGYEIESAKATLKSLKKSGRLDDFPHIQKNFRIPPEKP